jgi:hypothetical protein
VIITYKNLPGSPQYTAILDDWKFDPSIPADTFTFKPTEESIGVEILPAAGNDARTQQ